VASPPPRESRASYAYSTIARQIVTKTVQERVNAQQTSIYKTRQGSYHVSYTNRSIRNTQRNANINFGHYSTKDLPIIAPVPAADNADVRWIGSDHDSIKLISRTCKRRPERIEPTGDLGCSPPPQKGATNACISPANDFFTDLLTIRRSNR
jgi:hypothetical protein